MTGAAQEPTVGVLTDLWPSASEPHSGPFVRELALRLADSTRQVVLVPRLLARRAQFRVWGENAPGWQRGWERPLGVRVLPYPALRVPKLGETVARALGARLALRAARERPALVHGHFLYAVGPTCTRLARALGVPALLTAHGSDVRLLSAGPDRTAPRYWHEMLDACLGADAITVVAKWMVDPLTALGISEQRIAVVPMGADETVFRVRDREAARADLGLSAEERVLLFVGRATPAKGSEVLRAALESLGDRVRGYVAGPVAIDGVEHLGHLMPERLAVWLSASDLVCLPSYSEGMPVSVSEALASGIPVVGTAVGGLAEQIQPGVNGLLVQPGDPSDLAEAIVACLERDWDGEAIRATSERFWWSVVARRFEEEYARLLSGRSR